MDEVKIVNDDNMQINMQVVAKKAGVSSATVSRVLRNLPNVREETKNKVLKAVSELNYEVNAVARSLAKKETKIIGLIVTDIKGRFNAVVAQAVEDVAIENNYNVILCNNYENPDKELRYLKSIHSNRIDGVILMPTYITHKNINYINWLLLKNNIKMVIIDRLIKGVNCDFVLVDNEKGAYEAVKFLTDCGYKKIATIAGIRETTTGLERLNGYLRALKEANLKIDNDFIKFGDFQVESGIKLSKELFKAKKKPDAIFTANIQMLRGLLNTCEEKKIKIPDDIGVVTFDDIEWPDYLLPSITSVRQPVYDIGKIAAEILFKRLNDKSNTIQNKPCINRLDVELVIRGSTLQLK